MVVDFAQTLEKRPWSTALLERLWIAASGVDEQAFDGCLYLRCWHTAASIIGFWVSIATASAAARYGSAVSIFPPTAIRDPGVAPSLASPLHHHPLQTSPRAQTHRRPSSNSTNAKMCRCSTRGGADIKMDGCGDRHGLQHWQVYLFVKEEAIKHGWVFRRQGGLSLTGKWVKSKNVRLLLSDISSCCPRATNKTHTDSRSCSILTLRLTQQEKSLFWLL